MVVKLVLKRKNENIQIWSRYSLFKNTGCRLPASSSAALNIENIMNQYGIASCGCTVTYPYLFMWRSFIKIVIAMNFDWHLFVQSEIILYQADVIYHTFGKNGAKCFLKKKTYLTKLHGTGQETYSMFKTYLQKIFFKFGRESEQPRRRSGWKKVSKVDKTDSQARGISKSLRECRGAASKLPERALSVEPYLVWWLECTGHGWLHRFDISAARLKSPAICLFLQQPVQANMKNKHQVYWHYCPFVREFQWIPLTKGQYSPPSFRTRCPGYFIYMQDTSLFCWGT